MHVRFRVRTAGAHHHVAVFVGLSPDHTLAKAGDLVLRSRRSGNYVNTNAGADELEPLRFALATAPGLTFDLEDDGTVADTDRRLEEYEARGLARRG